MTIRATTNDITGDEIRTHFNSKEYVEGWERIWGENQYTEDSSRSSDKPIKTSNRTKMRG